MQKERIPIYNIKNESIIILKYIAFVRNEVKEFVFFFSSFRLTLAQIMNHQ